MKVDVCFRKRRFSGDAIIGGLEGGYMEAETGGQVFRPLEDKHKLYRSCECFNALLFPDVTEPHT